MQDVLDDLEEVLVTSDVGVNTHLKIIERIEARVSKDKYVGTDALNLILREEIAGLIIRNKLWRRNRVFDSTNSETLRYYGGRGKWCWKNNDHW